MSQISWAIEVYLTGEPPYVLKSEEEEKIEKLQADLEEARRECNVSKNFAKTAEEQRNDAVDDRNEARRLREVAEKRAETAERERDEARAALREIVSIQIDTSLRPIDAANKMCRVAVDALAATEEIDG